MVGLNDNGITVIVKRQKGKVSQTPSHGKTTFIGPDVHKGVAVQGRPVFYKINSQSLEDKQVGYRAISQKYTLDEYTLERAFKPSCTILSI